MGALPAENDRHEPLPLDPLGKRLCLTFPYLWQPIVGVNESNPNWQTVKPYPLRPRVLWRLWQDPTQLVGVRFDDQTCYGLIDVDKSSSYHPAQNTESLTTIRAALETIGIYRTIAIRSSWSEGLHLYIPLPEVVPTFALASTLRQCLEAQGLTIAQGQLEVFPNCKAYAIKGSYSEYNAHRLPLQPESGSYLLDADGHPTSQELGRFFEQWDIAATAQDMREVREAIATAKLNRKGKPHRQSSVVEEWRNDLRTEMEEGWTGFGQTNHLLKTIACYGVVFEGLTGDELIEFVHTSAIHAPGYLQWCRHQQDIHLKSTVWARSAEGYYWRLGSDRKRAIEGFHEAESLSVSMNLQRSEDAQQRIKAALAHLEAQGTLPSTPTARAKAIAAQGLVSLKTLYRHPELWHPEHLPDRSIAMEQWCKTAEPEPDRTVCNADLEPEPRSPNSSDDGKFYTLEKIMKGKVIESGLVALPPSQLLAQTARRFPVTNFCENHAPVETPKPLPANSCEAPSIVQLSFPQLQSQEDTDPQQQLELTCTEALVRGDRPWVLSRLLTLWREGHADLVRTLCKRHPGWGFQVSEAGLVEVSGNAPQR